MRRDCNHIPCKLPDCDCKIEPEGLEYVNEVEIPELGNLDDVKIKKIQDMAAKGEKRTIVQVAIPKESLLDRIYGAKKFKNTRVGSLLNKVLTSRRLGRVVDVLGLFIPQVGVIDRLTTPVKNILFKPNQKRGNNMNWLLNRLTEASTWRGIIVGVTGLGLSIAPGLGELIITAGVSLFALVEFCVKEPQSQDA